MAKAKSTPKAAPTAATKGVRTIEVPLSKADLHKGLDQILKTRTVSKSFGETLLQALWTINCQRKDEQVRFAQALTRCIDEFVGGGR